MTNLTIKVCRVWSLRVLELVGNASAAASRVRTINYIMRASVEIEIVSRSFVCA